MTCRDPYEHVKSVMDAAIAAVHAEDPPALPPPAFAAVATSAPPPAPGAALDAPRAVFDALVDAEHGGALRFAPSRTWPNVPDHPALPDLAKAARELVHEYATWSADLLGRAVAIAQLAVADERVAAFVAFEAEIEKMRAAATEQLEAKAAAMRATCAKLAEAMRGPGGDDLAAEDARRVAAHVQRLPEAERRAFLGRVERRGDHAVLRAVAADRLNRHLAPEVDGAALLDVAGRLRAPRNAAVAGAYAAFAARIELNVHRLHEETRKAHHAAAAGIDAGKLALARRIRQGR